jgi:hypothetical protein
VRGSGFDGRAEERRVKRRPRKDAQSLAVGERHAGAAAAGFKRDGINDLACRPRQGPADELKGPTRHAPSARFLPRVAAVDECDARPRPRQVARRHGAGRSGPRDNRIEGAHERSQRIVTATKAGDQAS